MPLLPEGENWSDYRRQMERFAYTYAWNAGLMNRDVAGHPWDVGNETAEQCQDRKNIFNLLTTTAGKYKHLYNSVPNGGAQLA